METCGGAWTTSSTEQQPQQHPLQVQQLVPWPLTEQRNWATCGEGRELLVVKANNFAHLMAHEVFAPSHDGLYLELPVQNPEGWVAVRC